MYLLCKASGIGGYSGNSTRTELAAAIVAIMANGPAHIGTDSQAFKDKADRTLHRLRCGRKDRRNWKTAADGDLWDHFERAAIAKGPKTIRITKVKGHVTQQQVDANVHRAVDKVGNDKADEAADVGVQTHGKDLIQVARIFHSRHTRYTKFMLDMCSNTS